MSDLEKFKKESDQLLQGVQAYQKTKLKILDEWLEQLKDSYKKKLNASTNQFLINEINDALKRIENGKKEAIKQLDEDLKKVSERDVELKKGNTKVYEHMKPMIDMREEMAKDRFERSISFLEKNWGGFIEHCKKEIEKLD